MKLLKLTHANEHPVLIPLDHISYVHEYGQVFDGAPRSIIGLVGNSYLLVMEPPAVVARKMRKAARCA